MTGFFDGATALLRRLAARVGFYSMLLLIAITDQVPPRWRFGHWQRVLDLLAVRDGLIEIRPKSVRPVHTRPRAPGQATAPESRADLRCLLVAGALDSGGIETVVSVLARGLPTVGIDVEVVCSPGGRTAAELRSAGVSVEEIQRSRLADVVTAKRPDVVQLHRMDADFISALSRSRVVTVPVFHAIESYLDNRTWQVLQTLLTHSPTAVAVSGTVRDYFLEHTSPSADISIVVNGTALGRTPQGRLESRRHLEDSLGVSLVNDTLVASLLRFSDQKNTAGLVDAFLLASEERPELRLLIAGSPDSWLEFRKADFLRRGHPHGDRVHLLGNSDPTTLLSAADIFALDSFAEGGPIAAVEAAAHGLPLVLSDVGFARELIGSDGVSGVLVQRASADMSESGMAKQRRKAHQPNRGAFAQGLVEASTISVGSGSIPLCFSEASMVEGHARVLRRAADGGRPRISS